MAQNSGVVMSLGSRPLTRSVICNAMAPIIGGTRGHVGGVAGPARPVGQGHHAAVLVDRECHGERFEHQAGLGEFIADRAGGIDKGAPRSGGRHGKLGLLLYNRLQPQEQVVARRGHVRGPPCQ